MITRLLNKIFTVYFFIGLLFPVLSNSSPGIEIEVIQPGTLILSVRIDSVWVNENGNIQTSPKLKSLVQPDQPSIPYISETLVGVSSGATLNCFPSEETVIPISTQLKLGIHESPKGMELQDNLSGQFQPQNYNQLAVINRIPDIKRRPSAVLKFFRCFDRNSVSFSAFIKWGKIRCGLQFSKSSSGTTSLSNKISVSYTHLTLPTNREV